MSNSPSHPPEPLSAASCDLEAPTAASGRSLRVVPSISPQGLREDLESALKKAFVPYGWFQSIEMSDESWPDSPTDYGSGVLTGSFESGPERVWARVRWQGAEALRRDFVESTFERLRLMFRVDGLEADRVTLRERFDAIQERMVERNRMAALGTMAASVAHDIRSPLTVLVSNLSYLEDELAGLDAQTAEVLRSVFEDNRLAVDLIEGVLDSMRTFVADFEAAGPVRLNAVISSAHRLTRWHFAKAKVALTLDIEGDPLARGTVGEIGQILMNLLSNAAEASPPGAEVTLIARRRDDQTYLWVCDEGEGVPESERQAIFEPFHTSKATGMGLGLSIAREMARRHRGELKLGEPPAGYRRFSGACLELRLLSVG